MEFRGGGATDVWNGSLWHVSETHFIELDVLCVSLYEEKICLNEILFI
jgi:hypothetical protein